MFTIWLAVAAFKTSCMIHSFIATYFDLHAKIKQLISVSDTIVSKAKQIEWLIWFPWMNRYLRSSGRNPAAQQRLQFKVYVLMCERKSLARFCLGLFIRFGVCSLVYKMVGEIRFTKPMQMQFYYSLAENRAQLNRLRETQTINWR